MKMTMKMSHPMMTTLAASLSSSCQCSHGCGQPTVYVFIKKYDMQSFLYLRTQENECRGGLRRTNHRTDIIATAPVNSLVINPKHGKAIHIV